MPVLFTIQRHGHTHRHRISMPVCTRLGTRYTKLRIGMYNPSTYWMTTGTGHQGKALWHHTEPSHRAAHYNGGQYIDIFHALARMVGIQLASEKGGPLGLSRWTGWLGIRFPGFWSAPAATLETRDYNICNYTDNLYIAQKAPRCQFIGVFLASSSHVGHVGHVVCEIPCGLDGETTICDSNQGIQCVQFSELGSGQSKYRNRQLNPAIFVWFFGNQTDACLGNTNPVYYILELKLTLDVTGIVFPTNQNLTQPRGLGDSFFDSPPASYVGFLLKNPDILAMLCKSATQALACDLLELISDVNPNRFVAFEHTFEMWKRRVFPIAQLVNLSMAQFTMRTFELAMQAANSYTPGLPFRTNAAERISNLFILLIDPTSTGHRIHCERVQKFHKIHTKTPWLSQVWAKLGMQPPENKADLLLELLSGQTDEKVADVAIPMMRYYDCVSGVVEFMGTMGNRMMPKTIILGSGRTTVQPWWGVTFELLGKELTSHFTLTECIDNIISRIVGNFPCQILGASDVYVIMVTFQIDTETAYNCLADVQKRHSQRLQQGWYLLDNILNWPASTWDALGYFKGGDIDAFSFEERRIFSSLYPFAWIR
jgi:hypothetical protein